MFLVILMGFVSAWAVCEVVFALHQSQSHEYS